MKRLFIISAAALALMASCAKVEPVVTDQPFTFAVANYAQQTRAEAYSTDDTFGVYAYWTSENWETDGTTNSFMTNDKVFYSPEYAQGQWGTRAKYYWPRTGKLTFACYSPYTAQGNEKGYSGVPAFNKTDGFVTWLRTRPAIRALPLPARCRRPLPFLCSSITFSPRSPSAS